MSCFRKIIPFFCVPVFLIAATGTWNVDASGNWETASNWTPGPPPDATTDIARFLAIITANRTVTINTPKTVQGTEFNNNFNYLISGSTLTYQNGAGVTLDVTGGTGQHSIASSVVLANNLTATITPAINFTISGPISGAGTLTKAGAGTLILSGTASNTFSGLTTVSAGGLTLSKSGGAVAIPGDLTIPGGTVTVNVSEQIGNSSAVTVNGGTLTFGAVLETFGSLNVTSGSVTGVPTTALLLTDNTTALTLGAVNLGVNVGILGAGSVDTTAASGATISGDFDLRAVSHDINVIAGVAPELTISGVISDLPGGGMVKKGAGTMVISGTAPNTYTGLTQVDAGVLNLNKTGVVAIGGDLTLTGGTTNLLSANQIHDSSTLTIDGGTFNMGGFNDTIGALDFRSATATLNQGGATLTMSSNATALTMLDQTISDPIAFTGSGAIVFNPANNNTATITGTVDLGTQIHNFDIANGTGNPDMDIQGVISGVGGGITKINAGTLRLNSGASPNTYTGLTTVNAGDLLLNTNANVVAIPGPLTINGGTVTKTQPGQIANTSVVTINGGTFDMAGQIETIESLFFNGGTLNQGGAILTLAANNPSTALSMRNTTISGPIVISGTGSVAFDNTNNGIATITGTLDLGGTVTDFNIADGTAAVDMDIQGVISNGGVNKTNAGTLQFSGAAPNTYAGNTTVNAGELILAKNAGVNAIAGDVIINGGLLTLQNNEQIANTSIMTINGGTFAMGPFTETIATLNYLGGNFSQSGGNLILASAGNALTMRNTTLNGNVTTTGGGSIVFDATNNGTAQMLGTLNLSGPTIFDIQNGTAAEDMVIHSTITSGGVIKNNTGTLVLLGPNTYGGGTTINGGVLQGTTTSLQGAITTNAAGTLAFNQAFDGTFTGTISGAGDLVKDGTGTVIFPSPTAQTVGGTTTINGGTLQVDGTLTGTGGTTIGANGTLAGTGTVISNISNFGTIAPGSGGIGTLSVTGNITMQSGSTLDMELTPTTTDLLNVSGTFTIDPNATFFFTPLVGDYTSGQTYTVVQGGVINGAFTQVNDPFPLFQGTLIHQANAILLQLELLPISSLPNLDSNAAKVAACLDAENPQPGEDLFDVVGSLRFLSTEEAIDKALLQMQPSPFVSLAVIKQESTGYIRNALYERLELRARECAEEKTGYAFWLAPLMGVSEQEKRHKGPGYNVLTPGIALGFDGFIWDAFQVGGALGYTNSDITWKSKRAVGRTQGIYASLYGRYGTEVAFVESALIGGYDYYTTKREIKMGGLLPLHRHAKGSHHGFEGSAHLKGVIQLPVGETKLGPYLGVDFLYSREGSFTETGARSLNLKVEGKSNTMLLSEGGMNISHCIVLQRKTLTPFAQIGAIWENRFAGKEIQSHLTACTLKNIGYYPSRLLFGASGGLNVKWGLKTAPKASLFYKGKYGQGYQDHSFTLELIY